jgi:hypothetical protein
MAIGNIKKIKEIPLLINLFLSLLCIIHTAPPWLLLTLVEKSFVSRLFHQISGVKWQSGTRKISRYFLVSNRETNDFSTSVRSSQGGAV